MWRLEQMKGRINGDINLEGRVMSAAIMTLTAITDFACDIGAKLSYGVVTPTWCTTSRG